MAGIQIPNQTNENDEPLFVLQNVSAMSRQVAQPKRRGWGIGWFQGGNNNSNNYSDHKNKNDTAEQEKKKLGDTSHAEKIFHSKTRLVRRYDNNPHHCPPRLLRNPKHHQIIHCILLVLSCCHPGSHPLKKQVFRGK